MKSIGRSEFQWTFVLINSVKTFIKDLKIEEMPPDNVMRSLAEILFPTFEEYFKRGEKTSK